MKLNSKSLNCALALAALTVLTLPAPAEAQLVGQLGVLDPQNANGGTNPATGVAWAVGDQYRLAFYTSTKRDAVSTDIADYNAFVQGVAAGSVAFPELGSGTWKLLGSTQTVSAKQNTGTVTNDGIPIFVLDGTTLIARDSDDMWNGFGDASGSNIRIATGPVVYAPFLNEEGAGDSGVNHGVEIATGTNPNGTTKVDQYLGIVAPATINVGATNANNTSRVWNRFSRLATQAGGFSFYALSDPLKISTGGPSAPFVITAFEYTPSADPGMEPSMVTLTWTSKPGANYAVRYSTDLTGWPGEFDDSATGDPDSETTTRSYPFDAAIVAPGGNFYIRVENAP